MRWMLCLLLTGCTIRSQDTEARQALAEHVQAIKGLQSIDLAIVEKLKELQDKGYLSKPKESESVK